MATELTLDERVTITITGIQDGAILANDLLSQPAPDEQTAQDVFEAMVLMQEGWQIIGESLIAIAKDRLEQARNDAA